MITVGCAFAALEIRPTGLGQSPLGRFPDRSELSGMEEKEKKTLKRFSAAVKMQREKTLAVMSRNWKREPRRTTDRVFN